MEKAQEDPGSLKSCNRLGSLTWSLSIDGIGRREKRENNAHRYHQIITENYRRYILV